MGTRYEYAESDVDEDGEGTIEIAIATTDPAIRKRARRLFESLVKGDEPKLAEVPRKGKADD